MIKVAGLTKKYGTLAAVREVSFEIKEGEIVGFLGPNGAGKSTTMNMITGCLSATSGHVTVNGKDILTDPLSAKREIGYLPEHPPVYGEMTVEEYLRFVYELKGTTLSREEHIREVCEVVKIADVKGRLIRNLSKGYRQRVGIAQALIGNPPVLIFDEPTVGLDPKQIIEVRNLLRTLGKNHTVILSTHILPEVQAVCNRLLVINEGEIIADRPTEELTRVVKDANRYRLSVEGTQNSVIAAMRAVSGVLRVDVLPERDGQAYQYRVETVAGVDVRRALSLALAEKKFPILAFEPISSNLEEVFLQLIEGGAAAPAAKKATRRAR